MEKYVETNLDFNAIKDYVPYVLDFKIDNLKTSTLPGVSGQATNGLWFYFVNEDEAQETINELFYGIGADDEDNANGENTEGNQIASENIIDGNSIPDDEVIDENVGEGITVEILNGSGSSSKLSE